MDQGNIDVLTLFATLHGYCQSQRPNRRWLKMIVKHYCINTAETRSDLKHS